jgi:hypothetical protein
MPQRRFRYLEGEATNRRLQSMVFAVAPGNPSPGGTIKA